MKEFEPTQPLIQPETEPDSRQTVTFNIPSKLQEVLNLLSSYSPEEQQLITSLEISEVLHIPGSEVRNRIEMLESRNIPIGRDNSGIVASNKKNLIGFFLNDKEIKVETEIEDTPPKLHQVKNVHPPRVQINQTQEFLRNFPPPKKIPYQKKLPAIDWPQHFRPPQHTLQPDEVPNLHDSAIRSFISKKSSVSE